MDTQAFLVGLLSVSGGGVFLWAIVAAIVKAIPALDANASAKFWLTMALAFVIPTGAYLLLVLAFSQTFAWQGLLLAVGAGYQLSQTIHRGTEAIRGVK